MSSLTWQEISQISASGKASQCFSVGDTKPFSCGSNSLNAKIVGFDRDTDTSLKRVGITFMSSPCIIDTFYAQDFRSIGYTFWDTESESTLENDIYPDIEGSLRSVIKTVRKTASTFKGENSVPQYDSESRNVEIFLFSAGEVCSSYEISSFEGSEDCVIGAPGSQYPYFSIKANRENSGNWLLREISRSDGYNNSSYWYAGVYIDGGGSLNEGAHMSWTFDCCFGFCV